jgi:hypothetical protein
MESRLRKKPVRIRAAGWLLAILFALGRSAVAQQNPPFYYNLDKEIRIEGAIQDIRFEPRYESSAPFLIVLMKDKTSGRMYSVEISPAGFFKQDVHKGEIIKVVGSLCNMDMICCPVIAREVQCHGETISVRDKQGFPVWRNASMPEMRHKMGKAGF